MIALKCPICGAPLPPPVRKGGRALEACRETAPITVEERDGVRIETRGRCCIGFRAVSSVKHI